MLFKRVLLSAGLFCFEWHTAHGDRTDQKCCREWVWKRYFFSLYFVISFPLLCSDHLFTLMVWLNDLSLRCAESDGWHREKHQQLFQNIPRAELPVKLYNLYQPRPRQDWGPLPWNWQNGLLQVNRHPNSWQNCKTGMRRDIFGSIFSNLPARLLWKWYKPEHLFTISSISTFLMSGKVVIPVIVSSQVDWLHYSVLHGCSGTGIQLPGPALRHSGIRQARLTNNTRLHLKHGGNDADGVSPTCSDSPILLLIQ